ncbi:hypothetical protein K1T71_005617 [Dendrolimus kikuchii]|uniref:Uncharacterized protein n=1 Tax=Dendrolimus kikuchii TaxID=765133 RepID=A0ACC1D5N6_9NEOP|nr:hypothetical protein K1T71_005617 [Dendrolimus kikuchii]
METKNNKLLFLFWEVRHLLIAVFIFSIILYNRWQPLENDITKRLPHDALKFVMYKNKKSNKLDIVQMREIVKERNDLQQVRNLKNFGPIKNNTLILVISVGKFVYNLKYLIASLSQVKGIEDTLLIFSHWYLDENVDNIIISIEFARVLQIYYPYSIQLFPREFPGYNFHDCPYYMRMKTAEANNCTGAFNPDLHGRYRHPGRAEKKHHWWWTANRVFECLRCTANHEGLVLFLQDDFYILDDFIYMVSRMTKIATSFYRCDFLSLGTDCFSNYASSMSYIVELQTWNPEHHSSVFGFNAVVWNNIASRYNLFCSIDDSSWSRSLFYVSSSRKDGKGYKVLSSTLPRAFKISNRVSGSWLRRDVTENVLKVLDFRQNIHQELFPPFIETYVHLNLELDEYVSYDFGKSVGGWNDPRDKMLCRNITESKIKKVLLDMQNVISN